MCDLLCQGCGQRADLLRHHQPRALWRLPGVQLGRVSAHVCPSLHGGDGVLRPDGAEASGAKLRVWGGSGRWEGRPGRATIQAEVSEDDHHSAGNVHALLPAFPPHSEPVLLLQIPKAGQPSTGEDKGVVFWIMLNIKSTSCHMFLCSPGQL